jgi:quercetin dioxygenase-like cupin family protein
MIELLREVPPSVPDDIEVTVVLIELPPGDAGAPPHRHPGPVFGFILEGDLRFQLEDENERVIGAGDAFWEPGGDVLHLTAANGCTDRWTRFIAVIVGRRGQPLMTFPTAAELAARRL